MSLTYRRNVTEEETKTSDGRRDRKKRRGADKKNQNLPNFFDNSAKARYCEFRSRSNTKRDKRNQGQRGKAG